MKPLEHIDESWAHMFMKIKLMPAWKEIVKLNPDDFYPAPESVFNVFRMPVQDIKVVILGQDPYPHENQAIGYSFAVSRDVSKPFSLKKIESEVGHPIDRTLQDWRDQGVFLLNTALTVKRKTAGSHVELWRPIIEEVITYITETNPCIWMLWGKYAQGFESVIINADILALNDILKAPHPAAEAYGGKTKFSGCGHFTLANELLKIENKVLINW